MKLSRIELKTLMKNKMMAAGLSEPHAETTAEILTWSHERGWIIFFTVIAAGLGTILSLIIQPGIGIEIASAEAIAETEEQSASLQETVLNFVPTNIMQAMSEGSMVPCYCFLFIVWCRNGNLYKTDWK